MGGASATADKRAYCVDRGLMSWVGRKGVKQSHGGDLKPQATE